MHPSCIRRAPTASTAPTAHGQHAALIAHAQRASSLNLTGAGVLLDPFPQLGRCTYSSTLSSAPLCSRTSRLVHGLTLDLSLSPHCLSTAVSPGVSSSYILYPVLAAAAAAGHEAPIYGTRGPLAPDQTNELLSVAACHLGLPPLAQQHAVSSRCEHIVLLLSPRGQHPFALFASSLARLWCI